MSAPARRRAVVLLSGGLDSATVLFIARARGYECHAIAFDYGQRHRRELAAARAIARRAGVRLRIVSFRLGHRESSLLDRARPIPARRSGRGRAVPSTYVPGRNLIFLSFAVSLAEAIGARAIFIGATAVDFSGYPDCRPVFYDAFERVIRHGTVAGARHRITVKAPLLRLGKEQIIRWGIRLGVPYALTWSCYRGGKKPCRRCDSCRFRQKGFQLAGLPDPAR